MFYYCLPSSVFGKASKQPIKCIDMDRCVENGDRTKKDGNERNRSEY